ncbi:MAG: DUF2752 domain-containing protein [Flavobacteriales bacterium]
MFQNIIEFIKHNMQQCSFLEYLGMPCPGCGIQRSVLLLVKGEFLNSLIMYPALIPIFILLIYLLLHLKFRFKNGAEILKYTFFIAIGLKMGNYFLILYYTIQPHL